MREIILGNFSSFVFYISVFSLSSILIYFGMIKKNKILKLIALIIPIIVATLRYGVGTDYFNYMRNFKLSYNINLKEYIYENSILETGKFFINKIGQCFDSYLIVLLVSSSLVIIFIYISIIYHKNKISVSLSFYIFLCIYFPMSFNIMLQYIAVALVAISYRYIFEKNIFKFTLIILFAGFFHSTALMMFPIYFLWSKKNNDIVKNWKLILGIIIMIFIALNYQEILKVLSELSGMESYSIYVTDKYSGNNRDIYMKFLLFVGTLIFIKPLIRYDKRNKLYILFVIFNLIIGITGYTSPFVKRISIYLEVSQIFLIPCFVRICNNINIRKIVAYLVYIYPIMYFFLLYYLLGQANVVPYKFIL